MNPLSSFRLPPIVLALVGAAWVSGCHLSQPASASFASVVITNRSADEIRVAATAVFAQSGYAAMLAGNDELCFEREGSRANEIAHGGWIADTGVRERVRARIVLLAPGQYRLQCNAYLVRHAGDAVLQDEVRLKNIRSRPYQKLLADAAERLK